MSEKRKDKRGRLLKTGEGQRKDGTYMYRYTDQRKRRKYVYAKTLEELRKKEEIIHRDLYDGIDYSAGEITVYELCIKYLNLKRKLGENSKRSYGSALAKIKSEDFGQRSIKDVKPSDAKAWFISLHDAGLKQNTISIIRNIVRPAFEMAVDDDMVRKNPFKFKINDIIPDDEEKRSALTKAQQTQYLNFILENNGTNYYYDILILLGTGLRVSELYGLTKKDIDFKSRCIYIERQLCRTAERPYFITKPKTKSGVRCIPMSDTVYKALKYVIAHRPHPQVEMMVDGYSGFLFLDKSERPKVAMHLQNFMRIMQKKYARRYGSNAPKVTPHVLRHTFCTNVHQAGIDVKSLQYLMGHSSASVTLDIYTHTDYDTVKSAFDKIAGSL